jgi:hypothetical protein
VNDVRRADRTQVTNAGVKHAGWGAHSGTYEAEDCRALALDVADQSRFPSLLRIVLSGSRDPEEAMVLQPKVQ